MNKNIQKLQNQAESNFSNFGGNGKEEFIGQNPQFSEFDEAEGYEELLSTEKEITIDIVSTVASGETAVTLFGSNIPSMDAAITNIAITVNGSVENYNILRRQLANRPMFVASLTALFSSEAQMRKSWIFDEIGLGGNGSAPETYQTFTKRNPNQNQGNQIDDASFNKKITGNTKLTVPVLAGATASITFQVGSLFKAENALVKGKHVISSVSGLTNVQKRVKK